MQRSLFFLLMLIAAPVVGDTIKEYKKNEYRFHGGALACLTENEADALAQPSVCLRIGNLFPGTAVKLLEARILAHGGKFTKDLPQGDGSVVRVYGLPRAKSEKVFAYLAVTYVKGVAKVLQLSGRSTIADLTFSSIHLGDSEGRLKDLLGEPSSKSPVPEMQGTLWSYSPFPFSMEIVGGKVVSIRIREEGP